MQNSGTTIEQTNRSARSPRLRAGMGVALLLLLATAGFWLNAGSDGSSQPVLPKSLLGTSVGTITVDGVPGVVIKELMTVSPDGGFVATYNFMLSGASAFFGKPLLSGPAHGNWRWVRGKDGLALEGFGVAYLFDADTKAVVGHEAVKWWSVKLLADGTIVNRWEGQYYDVANSPVGPKLTGDAQGGLLTETTPVN
jgi:hypothetical protein